MARIAVRAALGLLLFVVCCEAMLRLLPVSSSTETGYYFDDAILTYPAHHDWQVATGWDLRNAQRMRSNNYGFAADRDFHRDPNAVALIGDSFVEASMLAPHDRPGRQLESALGNARPVYAMGGPGSSLLDYAERIRFAHERFGIKDFVVLLERGDLKQALCGSGNVHAACLDRRTFEARTQKQPPASLVKKVLRQSAFAQYLFSQIKVSPAQLVRQTFSRNTVTHAPTSESASHVSTQVDLVATPSPAVDIVARAFIERTRPHVAGRLILLLDSDRGALRAGRQTSDVDRDRFTELARQAGAVVVDSEQIFGKHFATSPLSLDVGPYDAHLNALGIRLLMRAATAALQAPVTPLSTPEGLPRV